MADSRDENEEQVTLELKGTSSVSLPTNSKRYRENSSLSSILNQYGLEETKKEKQNDVSQKKKKERRPRGVVKENTFEREEQEDKRLAKQEKYLGVYQDVHRLKEYYYEDYLEQLQSKVEKQREGIKKKSLEMEEKLARERSKSKKKKKLQRVDVGHDENFLDSIPKSDYYKIISLEKKMLDEGKLKTHTDRDAFWQDIRKPHIFKSYFPPPKPRLLSHSLSYASNARSRTSSNSASQAELQSENYDQFNLTLDPHRPLTQIEEVRESSRPATREGASSQLSSLPQKGVTLKKQLDPYTLAKQAAAELDKRFPQLPLPKLSCFSDSLHDKVEDPEYILSELAQQRREKERRLFVKRLRRMYNLSQSHTACTQRIIHKHGDEFQVAQEGPELDELMAVQDLLQPHAMEEVHDLETENERPWVKHLRGCRRNILPIAEVCEDDEESSVEVISVTSAPAQLQESEAVVIPLELRELSQQYTTMESKKLSSLWSNYNRVLMPISSKN